MEKFLPRRDVWRDEDWDALGREIRIRETMRMERASGIAITNTELFDRGVLDPRFLARATGCRPDRTTWELYAGACRRNLDYHLWHEDRTAAAHGIENRVPFIDYRIVEFVASIPERHHAALFADKRILRRAASGLVPPRIVERPKGYFFYGKGQHHTFRAMHELLTRSGGSLVEQAIAGSARTGGPLDPDGFRRYAANVGSDGTYAGLPQLLVLANMGILAELADSLAGVPAARRDRVIEEVKTADWPAWIAAHSAAAPLAADHVADSTVVRLAPGVSLIEMPAGAPGAAASKRYCLARDGMPFEDVGSPGWRAFLAAADGRRSVARIIADHGLNAARTKRQIRDALERNLLVRVES
jgi:asparagine synthase (glutamine-hydrolysing)